MIAVLLLLALPLQAAELARRVVCGPAGRVMVIAVAADHAAAPGVEHRHAHGQAPTQEHAVAHADGHDHGTVHAPAQDPSHEATDHADHDHGRDHAGSCCKTCLAGCCSWVLAAVIDWPMPEATPSSYPRLDQAATPEPLTRGLERPPRHPIA
jgi:hypothetical protein